MAANIDMSNGRANFAFTGPREAIWHRLGSQLTPGAPIEVWQKEAGMNWDVGESVVRFDGNKNGESVFPNRKVLYRMDTGAPLSILSEDYKVVPPKEVLEFFRDLIEQYGMTLSTAGCLFNGTRFWALADTGRSCEPFKGDVTNGHLLFVTSIDGSLSNTAKFVATRVVCNNTMLVALNEKTKNVVRKTHRSIWDSTQVKVDLNLLNNSWDVFVSKIKKLADKKMTDDEVTRFFKSTFFDPKKDEDSQGSSEIKKVTNLMALYKNGAGAEYDYGTALGVLNSVTNLYTHGNGRTRNADRKFWSGYFDNNAKLLTMEKLLETC